MRVRRSHASRTVESLLVGAYGRLRGIAVAPDGSLWVTTSNRDQAFSFGGPGPGPEDDRLLRITP